MSRCPFEPQLSCLEASTECKSSKEDTTIRHFKFQDAAKLSPLQSVKTKRYNALHDIKTLIGENHEKLQSISLVACRNWSHDEMQDEIA